MIVPPARYRPSDLPRDRDYALTDTVRTMPVVMTDFVASGRQQVMHPAVVYSDKRMSAADIGLYLAERERERLAAATLYYVAPDMTALAMTAGADLPDYAYSQVDLPSPSGFLVFDGPVPEVYDEPWEQQGDCPASLVAVSWGPVSFVEGGEVRGGTWFSYYSDRDLGDAAATERGLLDADTALRMLPHRGHFIYDNESLIFDGASWRDIANPDGGLRSWLGGRLVEPEPGGPPRVGPRLLRTLLAASLLMRQPLAEHVDARDTYDRHTRKRLARDGYADTEVRLVHLRQRVARESAGEGRDVDWACRWPVRGHWRNVAYGPGRAERRPVYVAPFIKGPADKPLRVRETVKVWDR